MSEQGYFTIPLLKKILTFLNDTFCIPASLSSPGKGYHAKRTHVVAATHDAYKCCNAVAVQTHGRNICIGLIPAQQNIHCLLTCFRFFDQSGQGAVCIGPHHDINEFFFFNESYFKPFCHTAQYTDDQTGLMFFYSLKLGEALAHGLLGFFPDGAGVDKDEVGIFGSPGGAKAVVHKNGSHHFAVGKVHGTAIALNIKMFFIRVHFLHKGGKSLPLPCFVMCFIGCQIQHLHFFYRTANITQTGLMMTGWQ